MGEVRLLGYKCERCYHVWVPRRIGKKPVICPSCKSPYWDRRREVKIRSNNNEKLGL